MPYEEEELVVVLHEIISDIKIFCMLFIQLWVAVKHRRLLRVRNVHSRYSLKNNLPHQLSHMSFLVGTSDVTCRDNLRMNMDTFDRLCYLLENIGGLQPTRNVLVQEQVAIFLYVLAHHKKIVVLRTNFRRSGYTISKYFNRVLKSVLRLHTLLLVTPEPVDEDCDNERWSYFKGSLGALDGTYVNVRVSKSEKARYRNREGDVSVNVLAVCDTNMNFVFLLTGWEGSAADSRILRDAVTRPNGLKVLQGNYYLVDCGYTNGDGFLAPYRSERYHLKDFGTGTDAPQNHREFFNMKHAKARNIIERAFGLLKSRWGILRSFAYYPIKQQNRIVMACCLLHNFIRLNMDFDPEEDFVDEEILSGDSHYQCPVIQRVEVSQQWTDWKDTLAITMYNEWLANG